MSSKEAFENVIGKVVKDTKEEIRISLEKAYKDALDIIEDERKKAVVEAEEIAQSEDRQAEAVKKRILLSAELEVRKKSLRILDETIGNVFEEFLKELDNLSASKGYDKVMKSFLEEGITAIGGNEFIIYANTKDKNLLNRIGHEVEKSRNVKIILSSESHKCKGGLQISNSDGSVIYDNTIEMKLERLKPLLRKQLSNILKK